MDPAYIGTDQWHGISVLLRFLGAYIIFIFGFALTFLTAHAIVPSLVDSQHLSPRFLRWRSPLYVMAFASLAVAMALFVMTSLETDVIGDFWDRWWI